MSFYLGIAALVAVLLVFGLIICGARYDDTLNNTTDEHADQRNFGFEAGTIHAVANSHREQHDHA